MTCQKTHDLKFTQEELTIECNLLQIAGSKDFLSKLAQLLHIVINDDQKRQRFQTNIRILQQIRGITTLDKLAVAAKKDRGYISKIISSKTNFSVETLLCLASALNVRATTLLELDIGQEIEKVISR